MTDTATLETWLTQVEEAIQRLSVGEQTVSISFDGQSRTFNQTTIGTLYARRAELRRLLGQPDSRRRPFGVSF